MSRICTKKMSMTNNVSVSFVRDGIEKELIQLLTDFSKKDSKKMFWKSGEMEDSIMSLADKIKVAQCGEASAEEVDAQFFFRMLLIRKTLIITQIVRMT